MEVEGRKHERNRGIDTPTSNRLYDDVGLPITEVAKSSLAAPIGAQIEFTRHSLRGVRFEIAEPFSEFADHFKCVISSPQHS